MNNGKERVYPETGNEAINSSNQPGLSNAVCSCSCLEVILRVEIRVNEDDCVCSSKVEALASRSGAQEEDKCLLIL